MKITFNPLLAAVILSLSGCAIGTTHTSFNPETNIADCEASYASLFKDSDKLSLSACGAKGSSSGANSDVLRDVLLKALQGGD